MSASDNWVEAQKWENSWWSSCTNTFQEEQKQISYLTRCGIIPQGINGQYPVYDFQGKSVLDIGCGPVSVLLKSINMKNPTCLDPCNYPFWVKERYKAAGINFIQSKAEDGWDGVYDIGLIYNCLQHTENPEKIIKNMMNSCRLIYIHEWLNTAISDGHLQTITEEQLNNWLDTKVMTGFETWNSETVTKFAYGCYIGDAK